VRQDREQVLAAIDTLLLHQPVTSQHLTNFIVQHPDVLEQQANDDDDDVPLRRHSDTRHSVPTRLTADTSNADSADTDSSVVVLVTPTRRHKSVSRSLTHWPP